MTAPAEKPGVAPPRRWNIVAVFSFIAYYLPFLGGPAHTHLSAVDNLDSTFVCGSVVGLFYRHPAQARHLLLAGHLPIYLIPSLTWPTSLLNLTDNHFLAYVLTDLIVRLIALFSMFALARCITSSYGAAVTAALLFAFAIAFPGYGLTIAALPAVVLLLQKESEEPGSRGRCALLFCFGWNSFLVLILTSLLLVPVIQRILFGPSRHFPVRAWVSYLSGLALGSAGLIYAIVIRLPLHRSEFALPGVSASMAVRTFLEAQFSPINWEFGSMSLPLAFLYISAVLAFAFLRTPRLGAILLLIVCTVAVYSVMHYEGFANLKTQAPAFVRAFTPDRFYMVNAMLIMVAWLLAWNGASPRFRQVLLIAATLQAIAVVRAPHLNNAIGDAIHQHLGRQTLATFADYYKEDDYRSLKATIGDAPVLNVGLDPMAAVLSHLATIDGYYAAYPLEYKHRFRSIIASQLTVSGKLAYFDGWGSRLDTFSTNPASLTLDYCAAASLGARFVISRYPVGDIHLVFVRATDHYGLELYRISQCPTSPMKL
ncbi:MAG TPA: DUF6044 family protein [Bryobacteraceae bacterium]|nr:DUF6044 family protein [Bryobacteraceae bacterium]